MVIPGPLKGEHSVVSSLPLPELYNGPALLIICQCDQHLECELMAGPWLAWIYMPVGGRYLITQDRSYA